MTVQAKKGPDITQKAANVSAPAEIDADGKGGQIVLSYTGSTTVYVLPTWLKGRFVNVTAVGNHCDIQFGDSAVTVTYGQVSTTASTPIVITPVDTSGGHLTDGAVRPWRIPKHSRITHFALAGAGAGKLYIEPA